MTEPNFIENKLFRGIPSELAASVTPRPARFEAGDIVFRDGDPAECLFLIETGTVRISKQGRGGRQETLAYFGPRDFFGEMGLYGGTTRSAQATAVGPVVVGCLERRDFEELLRAEPVRLVENLLQESVSRLRETDAHLIREMLEAERLSLVGSMLSAIVHDIRGPLSVIRGSADLLAEERDDGRRLKYTAMLRRGVDRIADMTQELLDYARGTTRLNLESVSPRAIMGELDEEVLRPLASSGIDIHFAVGFDDPIPIDRRRFFRVLHNIVKNAAEAMPQGGRLTITVEGVDGRAVFRIADTGVGIPADVLPTIFEPFVTHGKAGGTGLGMAIVHSVVEAHGGTILVESTPGKGTSFTITLPASARPVGSPE